MNGPRVLIACEYSGVVRNAFLDRGFDAWSCDLLPSEDRSNRHITGDALDILGDGWDMMIVAHPPCTRLCNSGVRWLTKPPTGKTLDQMWAELDQGAALFSAFWNAPIASYWSRSRLIMVCLRIDMAMVLGSQAGGNTT